MCFHICTFYFFSVFFQNGHTCKSICVDKKILVDNSNLILFYQSCNILIIEFYFLHLWRRFPVSAICNSISTEIVIAGTIIKISAICLIFFSVTIFFINRLINIIPDKSTLIQWLCISQIRIFMHGTAGISHRMGIFATNKRFCSVFCQKFFNAFHRCIHLTFHITGIIISTVMEQSLIMYQSGRIFSFIKL